MASIAAQQSIKKSLLNQSIFASQENLSEIMKKNVSERDDNFEITNLWEDFGSDFKFNLFFRIYRIEQI